MKNKLSTILVTAFVTAIICSLCFVLFMPNNAVELSEEDSAFLKKFHTLKEYIDEYAIYEFDEEYAEDTVIDYYYRINQYTKEYESGEEDDQ